jgi:exonuclease III
MKFGTWNVRSLCRAGLLKAVARELGKYKLDLVGVQELRWEKGGTERAERIIHFSVEKGMKIINYGQFFVHKRIISAVRRVEFVSNRMSCNIKRSLVQYYCSECARPM